VLPLLLITPMACGARTGLDVCTDPDAARSCENACGAGVQRCIQGLWTPCAVPPAQRVCTDACGSGSQTCSEGMWSACAVPRTARSCAAQCGPGEQTCADGVWGVCEGPEAGAPVISAKLWDFEPLMPPDFAGTFARNAVGLDPDIVATTLGDDGTPVYAGTPTTRSTHGATDFAAWYHDSPLNLTTSITLPFGPAPNDSTTYASENTAFFPVDNQLFGNEAAGVMTRTATHNYYFTVAFALQFRYRGGETFRFASDDDSWVFINRRLAVNLGGVHGRLTGSVNLDANSQSLGITVGQAYTLNFFYADRQPVQAILDMQVPAADFAICADGGLPL
jgi:fibro-slime domain-containing protein